MGEFIPLQNKVNSNEGLQEKVKEPVLQQPIDSLEEINNIIEIENFYNIKQYKENKTNQDKVIYLNQLTTKEFCLTLPLKSLDIP